MVIFKFIKLLHVFALAHCVFVAADRADITGLATVIEGGVLAIDGEQVRLHGIDAPERGQSCKDENGQTYRCGEQAARVLADKIGAAQVSCVELDRDRHGRIVAQCTADGSDLGEWMVLNGWAVAHTYVSYEYTRAQYQAKRARRGIWAGRFVKPWQWREGRRLD